MRTGASEARHTESIEWLVELFALPLLTGADNILLVTNDTDHHYHNMPASPLARPDTAL